MRPAPLRVLAAGAACLAVGCGSSSSPSHLSAAAADRMNQAVAATRAAADARDREKAFGALRALSAIVGREARAGRLSSADERAMRTGIAQARRRVELAVTAPAPLPPPPPPPTEQSAPVAPAPPEQPVDEPETGAAGADNERQDAKPDKPEKPEKPEKAAGGNGKGDD